jgi:hypothetical protein
LKKQQPGADAVPRAVGRHHQPPKLDNPPQPDQTDRPDQSATVAHTEPLDRWRGRLGLHFSQAPRQRGQAQISVRPGFRHIRGALEGEKLTRVIPPKRHQNR